MRVKAYNKDEILQKGLEVLYKGGYNGTGVQDIVDAAGIPKGSFYNYFKSKEDFAVNAIDMYIKDKFQAFSELLADKKISPLKRLSTLVDAMVGEMADCDACSQGCFVGNMSQEMAGDSPKIREKLNSAFSLMEHALAKCISEGIEEGEISKDKDPVVLSQFMTVGMQGAFLRMKTAQSTEPILNFREIMFKFLLV